MTVLSTAPECPYTHAEDLAAEITELSAYLYAATYRLLVLIHEFDQNNCWEYLGVASCAHWLNFKCGIGIHAAREKVRVANALADLPTMSARFKRGELSYSKVRAMTRIANEENEDYLLGIAKHGTAHHVEKLVSLYRGCIRQQDNENANEAHRKRELQCHYDTDGCLVIHGRIPAAQGALILKALDRAMEKNDQPKPYNQKVPAGTARRMACDCSIIKLTEDSNGEPLSIGRKTRTIPPAINRALRSRDKGCCFPGCTNTKFIDGHHIQHWADGGETSLNNLVQLCRRHHRLVHEGGFSCELRPDGRLVFEDQRGDILPDYFELPFIDHHHNPAQWVDSKIPNLSIDANTCVPETVAGERMDWNLAVGHLFTEDKPSQPHT